MPGVANRDRWLAMQQLRRSNAAQPHRNRRRDAQRGLTKGGRRQAIRAHLAEQ